MRREVLVPAVGWIIAGAISILTWYIELKRGMAGNLIYIGIFAATVGIMLLVFNQRAGKIIDYYKNKEKERGEKKVIPK